MATVSLKAETDFAGASSGPSEISRRLESPPTSSYLCRLVILLSLGGCFEISDLFLTGYIAPGLARSGLLSTTTASFFGFYGIGALVAATFAGLFAGTFRLSRRLVRPPLDLHLGAACLQRGLGDHGVPDQRGLGEGVAVHRRDRHRSRDHHRRRLHHRARAELDARARLHRQGGGDVHRRADRGVPRVVVDAAVAHGPRWLALGGADRRCRQHGDLGAAAACARKPALARAPRPRRRGDRRPAHSRGCDRAEQPSRYDGRRPRLRRGADGDVRRPVQAALSVAGRDVHGVQSLPGVRLLRLCQLGADAADRARHYHHHEPAICPHRRLAYSIAPLLAASFADKFERNGSSAAPASRSSCSASRSRSSPRRCC